MNTLSIILASILISIIIITLWGYFATRFFTYAKNYDYIKEQKAREKKFKQLTTKLANEMYDILNTAEPPKINRFVIDMKGSRVELKYEFDPIIKGEFTIDHFIREVD